MLAHGAAGATALRAAPRPLARDLARAGLRGRGRGRAAAEARALGGGTAGARRLPPLVAGMLTSRLLRPDRLLRRQPTRSRHRLRPAAKRRGALLTLRRRRLLRVSKRVAPVVRKQLRRAAQLQATTNNHQLSCGKLHLMKQEKEHPLALR